VNARTAPDLSTWLTEPEAAAALQISPRTLRRMCADGRGPQSAMRPVPGRKPERVYDQERVDELASQSAPPQALIAVPVEEPRALARTLNVPTLAAAGDVMSVLQQFAAILRPSATPGPTAWLTLDEAAAYSGLSRTFLARMVQDGELPSVRDRSIKVRRADLDDFVPDNLAASGQSGRAKRPNGPNGPNRRARR
jgi:excisionase family DNA binding protein